MKAALYCRVSTEEQTEGYSLDAQLDAMRDYAKGKGYEVAGEYIDGGYSGRTDNRPEFKKMIADAQAKQFNYVLVHKFDRFARNRAQAVAHKALLKNIGIPVISVLEPTDPDSPTSIILEGMLEVMAEWYSANLAQEVRKGKFKSAQSGRWQGGWLKFGYQVNENGFFETNEREAKALLLMFEKVSEGFTLRQLVQWLYNEGIATKRGGNWTTSHLSNILKDRTYIGEGRYGKMTNKGNRLVKSQKTVSVPYPLIIPKDLFDKAQFKLSENKRKNKGATKEGRFYLLHHLGKCGECGGTLLCQTSNQHRYLYCSRQATYPHIYQCYQPIKRWNLDYIEKYVWNEVDFILSDYKENTYDLLFTNFNNAKAEREQQISQKQAQLEDLKWERQRILTQIRKGNITEAEADIQFAAINSDKERLEWELTNLTSLQNNDQIVVDTFLEQLEKLRLLFDWGFYEVTPQRQKEILNLLLKEFVLYKDSKIELRFKLPVNEKQVAESISTLSQHDGV